MELQAQAVELLSILTTKRFATKEPRKVERPSWVTGGGSPDAARSSNPFARAIDRMLAVVPARRAT